MRIFTPSAAFAANRPPHVPRPLYVPAVSGVAGSKYHADRYTLSPAVVDSTNDCMRSSGSVRSTGGFAERPLISGSASPRVTGWMYVV